MLQIFSNHLAFFSMLLIWLVTMTALVFVLNYAKRQKRKYADLLQQERHFYEVVEKEGAEGYAMIRMSDHCPLYVSKSMKPLFGIPCDLLEKDLEVLMQITEPAVYREFREAWKNWSYMSPLVFDFPYTHPDTQENRWGKVIVTCVQNGKQAILLFRDITDQQTRLRNLLEGVMEERNIALDEELDSMIKRLLMGAERISPEAEELMIEKSVEELLNLPEELPMKEQERESAGQEPRLEEPEKTVKPQERESAGQEPRLEEPEWESAGQEPKEESEPIITD